MDYYNIFFLFFLQNKPKHLYSSYNKYILNEVYLNILNYKGDEKYE